MSAQVLHKLPKRQQGLTLLVTVVIIILAFASYLVSNISLTEVRITEDKNTQIALKAAKNAVINYAVTYSYHAPENVYGIPSHPETRLNGSEGNIPGSWGTKNTNIVEWLPWRKLDIANLKDDSDTCLFFAVSGTYKEAGSAQPDMINEDSVGMLRVVDSVGNTIQDQIVALVIAPGRALPGQVRAPLATPTSCGQDYGNVSAYLEGNGATDNSTLLAAIDRVDEFIHATDTSPNEDTPYNDKFLTITREEIWEPIVKRSDFKLKMENLTHALALCLAEYANQADNTSRRLPWPVITNLGGTLNYRDENNYVDDDLASEGYSGRFPFNITNSNNAINAASLTDDEILNTVGLCNNLDLGGGVFADLVTPTAEYRKLWDNWKDHFFYVLSKDYEPANSGAQSCDGAGVCISVKGTERAAAVIFSGSRLAGVTRIDKSDIFDYLEGSKATDFDLEATNKTGDRFYDYNPPTDTVNDVIYCVEDKVTPTDNLTVSDCL